MSFKSKSSVWHFFKYEEDAIKVKCNICSSLISRGGTGKKASTSPLLNHLKRKHLAEYNKITFCSDKSQPLVSESADDTTDADCPSTSFKRSRLEQPTLETVLERKKIWDINNPKAVELHYAIGQMIAVDNQPYLFVEDEGFRNLMSKAQPLYKVPSREYFKQVVIPKMYTECKEEIESMLSLSTYISLTTDMWTNSVKDSFISFTAHWIDNDFNYRHIVLNSRHFPGSHTGENISTMLSALSEEWNVTKKIYLVIRDGGSNIINAVNELNLNSESCFLHNLHLIVSDALNSQRAVKDIIAIGRKIVGHFNHSSLACSRFKDIQENQLHVQYKKVVQDVSTRWNSTFYMLSRLLELQNAISLYANVNSEIQSFSPYQWTLIENCVKLLQPFEEITKQISCTKSLISEVIPMVVTLDRYLSKSVEVHGIGTMKETLERNINKRFSAIQLNKHYSLATILDPRFKLIFFDKAQGYDDVAKSLLLSLMKEETKILKSQENVNESLSQYSNSEMSGISQVKEQGCSFWDVFSEITNTSDSNKKTTGNGNDSELSLMQELNKYISQPIIERNASPLSWWKTNENNFPTLAKLVRKYLSPPASSIYSERLFSEAGIIYEQRRNRILPQNAEQLLFLHHNLPILKNLKSS